MPSATVLRLPFFLRKGFEIREIDPWKEKGQTWRRLHITSPTDVPTHPREQVFYLNPDGFLMRLHYTVEVFGAWAKAARYRFDHKSFSGLIEPLGVVYYPGRATETLGAFQLWCGSNWMT